MNALIWNAYINESGDGTDKRGLEKPYQFLLFVKRLYNYCKTQDVAAIAATLQSEVTIDECFNECIYLLKKIGSIFEYLKDDANEVMGIKKRKRKVN